MRILFATNYFPPTHMAGTETYTYALARELHGRGHTVSVVCAGAVDEGMSHSPRVVESDIDGISVVRLHYNWARARDIFMDLADNAEIGTWFASYLRRNRPDILHITSCDTLSTQIITVAKALNLPVIVTLTDFGFLCMRHTLLKGDGTCCDGPESPWGCLRCLAHDAKIYTLPRAVLPESVVRTGLLWASTKPTITRKRGLRGVLGDVGRRQSTVRSALLAADTILAPTAFLREMFVRNGYPPERIAVSPYGLDYGWLPQDKRKDFASGLRVGYLGQIEPLKGVDILVRAFHQVDEPNARLTLHGNHRKNPAYTAELRRLSDGDPRISIVGPFTRDERATVLRNVDVVAVPSRWYENAPFVIAESHAMETPVIAANLGGMAEVVRDGIDGLLFAPDNADSLADCLRRITDNPDLLSHLRAGIQPPRTVSDDAGVLYLSYRKLVETTISRNQRPLSVIPGALV